MDTLNSITNQDITAPYALPITSNSHISNRGILTHKSYWIRKRKAQNILNAHDYAEWSGNPLNTYIVIHLQDTIAQSSSTAYRKIIHKFTTWLAYKRKIGLTDCPPIYIFTHENPNDNPHVNICLHIPSKLHEEFCLKLPGWIEAVQGELKAETLSNQPIKPDDGTTVVRYCIKGIDPEFIDHFGLRELYSRKGPQGLIYGQRAGFSRSLGQIMKRDGFDPMAYYRRRRIWG